MVFQDRKANVENKMELEVSGANEIAALKSTLFDVLEAGVQQDSEITATQQLGVQMTNAVKRNGITIIQNQNVQVMNRMMPLMVKALKYCERIESSYGQFLREIVSRDTEVIEIRQPQEEVVCIAPDRSGHEDPIKTCCQDFFERGVQWQDFQDEMKQRYLAYVSKQFRTKQEAAKWLSIGATYISKLPKQMALKNRT